MTIKDEIEFERIYRLIKDKSAIVLFLCLQEIACNLKPDPEQNPAKIETLLLVH